MIEELIEKTGKPEVWQIRMKMICPGGGESSLTNGYINSKKDTRRQGVEQTVKSNRLSVRIMVGIYKDGGQRSYRE